GPSPLGRKCLGGTLVPPLKGTGTLGPEAFLLPRPLASFFCIFFKKKLDREHTFGPYRRPGRGLGNFFAGHPIRGHLYLRSENTENGAGGPLVRPPYGDLCPWRTREDPGHLNPQTESDR